MSDFPFNYFPPRDLSADETGSARDALNHLRALERHIQNIYDALRLIDQCESEEAAALVDRNQLTSRLWEEKASSPNRTDLQREIDRLTEFRWRSTNWQGMAAREIAMTIYDFYRSMGLAKSLAQRAKVYFARLRRKEMDDAIKLFQRHFPDAKALRNAAGHPVDYFGKPDDRERNSQKGPANVAGINIEGGAVGISRAIMGRTLLYTSEGRTLKLDLTDEIVVQLTQVKNDLLRSFEAPPTAR